MVSIFSLLLAIWIPSFEKYLFKTTSETPSPGLEAEGLNQNY
jgi:hypothetical protein